MSCWVFYIQSCSDLASLKKSITNVVTHQKNVILSLDLVMNQETLVIAYESSYVFNTVANWSEFMKLIQEETVGTQRRKGKDYLKSVTPTNTKRSNHPLQLGIYLNLQQVRTFHSHCFY